MRKQRRARCAYCAEEPGMRNRNFLLATAPPRDTLRKPWTAACSQELPLLQCGAQHQPQLARLGNCRATAQHVIALPLDGIQYFLSAAAKQLDIERNLPVHHLHQWQS